MSETGQKMTAPDRAFLRWMPLVAAAWLGLAVVVLVIL